MWVKNEATMVLFHINKFDFAGQKSKLHSTNMPHQNLMELQIQ